MKKNKNEYDKNFMEKVATFIVDKRNLFFLIFILASLFSIVSSSWVDVENDITTYLPETTETRRGMTVMNREFTTFGSANIMISNVSFAGAEELSEKIEKIKGVKSVKFDNTDEHFAKCSALLSVTFDGTTGAKVSKEAMAAIKKFLAPYDAYISSSVGYSETDSLAKEMRTIIIIAAFIILAVLLFTSKAYAEVPVLILTFASAALLNKGTNFMVGKISFISDSVAIILQLALSIDYAIIFCHRYTEERENLPQREAVIKALSKAIPEILSSSLTTISGLAALITMRFKIGQDLSIVLIKAILLSLLSVFTLMPGLIMIFGKQMIKTTHKNYVPKINYLGKFDLKTKYSVPILFMVIMVITCILANLCPYCYGNTNLSTPHKSEAQITRDKIKATFKQTSLLAIVVPAGNYEKESALLKEFGNQKEVDSTLGLANTEAMGGYMLTDKINSRQFSELTEVDFDAAQVLYAAYAADKKDYGHIVNNLSVYQVPIIDMLEFLNEEIEKGYVNLPDEVTDKVTDIHQQISAAKKQLQSKKYSRMLVNLNIPEEGKQTFAFLDKMHTILKKYYPNNAYIVGNSTSDYDLESSFSQDNIIISILSALFVVIILFFTFKSAGLPILLIAVIQGSIWINFSFPYLENSKLFFLGYLIVNAIQMGANIDYAIVISSRYAALKKQMPLNEAIVETLNQSFPTIITSGTILASAGLLIGRISTNGVISAIGICLGRGTIISIILVMAVLPQILLLGDKIIERTAFKLDPPEIVKKGSGTVFINGRIVGKVSGFVDASVRGIVKGTVEAIVKSGTMEEESVDDADKETKAPAVDMEETKGGNDDEN